MPADSGEDEPAPSHSGSDPEECASTVIDFADFGTETYLEIIE
jgi:hypothetical protein